MEKVFILIEFPRIRLRDLDGPVLQFLNVLGRLDAGELHERAAGVDAHTVDRGFARLLFIGRDEGDGAKIREALGRIGPRFDAGLAADPMRFSDDAEGDAVAGHGRQSTMSRV